jgi:hypothetical protein
VAAVWISGENARLAGVVSCLIYLYCAPDGGNDRQNEEKIFLESCG